MITHQRGTSMSLDIRHTTILEELLMISSPSTTLEIGCYDGHSSAAFINAATRGLEYTAHFCDIKITDVFRRMLTGQSSLVNYVLHETSSLNIINTYPWDFIHVDGNHTAAHMKIETDMILRNHPRVIVAHDTNSFNCDTKRWNNCNGACYFKHVVQCEPDYYCIEDAVTRPDELTQRGLFFATTDLSLFSLAKSVFASMGEYTHMLDNP